MTFFDASKRILSTFLFLHSSLFSTQTPFSYHLIINHKFYGILFSARKHEFFHRKENIFLKPFAKKAQEKKWIVFFVNEFFSTFTIAVLIHQIFNKFVSFSNFADIKFGIKYLFLFVHFWCKFFLFFHWYFVKNDANTTLSLIK